MLNYECYEYLIKLLLKRKIKTIFFVEYNNFI